MACCIAPVLCRVASECIVAGLAEMHRDSPGTRVERRCKESRYMAQPLHNKAQRINDGPASTAAKAAL
jgi:hypothetical protein